MTNQDIPSVNPYPEMAELPWQCHGLPLIDTKSNFSIISLGSMTAISYLLANTNKTVSFKSSSANIAWSSFLALSILFLSEESTTKIRPSAF